VIRVASRARRCCIRLAIATRSSRDLRSATVAKRFPIASEQSTCDPAGSEQANDAADDARHRNAQHQGHAGIGIGREIGAE